VGVCLSQGTVATSTPARLIHGLKMTSMRLPNTAEIEKASGRLGSYRPFSIALMV